MAALATFLIIKSCEISVYSWVPNTIESILLQFGDEGVNSVIYNLAMGYIVGYIFYVIINFIPEVYESCERRRKEVKLRCAIQREVQLFTVKIISLWGRMAKFSEQRGNVNTNAIQDIEDLFNIETLREIAYDIQFNSPSGTVSYSSQPINWKVTIQGEIEEINKKGNIILTRYKGELDTELYYHIFYLINEGMLQEDLNMLINAMTSINGMNRTLGECMDWSKNGSKYINQTCKSICELYEWVNTEHKYLLPRLSSQTDIAIYGINVKDQIR